MRISISYQHECVRSRVQYPDSDLQTLVNNTYKIRCPFNTRLFLWQHFTISVEGLDSIQRQVAQTEERYIKYHQMLIFNETSH